jgi:acyl dehydratase
VLAWAYEIVGDPPPVIVDVHAAEVTAQMTVLDRTHVLGAGQGMVNRFLVGSDRGKAGLPRPGLNLLTHLKENPEIRL